MTTVLVVSGPSGSGKTTLIERLIPELTRRGFRVAAAKHDPHGHATVDVPGKDSWRFAQAGADVVEILGPERRASLASRGEDPSGFGLSAEARNCDIVLVEGFKTGELPRLEVVPADGHPVFEPGTVALIADSFFGSEIPVFGRDSIEPIGEFIVSRFVATLPAYVVLAGGASRRMGRDKATITLPSGETMLERAIAAGRPTAMKVLVVSRDSRHESLAAEAGAEFLLDDGPRHPAQGLSAALRRLDGGPGVVAAPCDIPGLRPEVLGSLAEVASEQVEFACYSIAGRLRPLPGYFASSTTEALEHIALKGLRLYQLAGQVPSRVLSEHEARLVDSELASFSSVNTPEDWRNVDLAGHAPRAGRPPREY